MATSYAKVGDEHSLLIVDWYNRETGKWLVKFLGGTLRPGETAEQTATRKVHEEGGTFPNGLELVEERKSLRGNYSTTLFFFQEYEGVVERDGDPHGQTQNPRFMSIRELKFRIAFSHRDALRNIVLFLAQRDPDIGFLARREGFV